MNNLSIIIPTLNANDHLEASLKAVHEFFGVAEIIVADGGSSDGTLDIARARGARVVQSAKGRGVQCNAGAREARGDIYFFLHADTLVSLRAAETLRETFNDPKVCVATFRLAFDHNHWILCAYAYLSRVDSVFTRFGDQGIVVRRDFFQELGGFPDWPLFEDVHFLRTARRLGRIPSMPAVLVTSAKRFTQNGMIRQQMLNAALVARYLFGVSPVDLAAAYEMSKLKR